MKKLFACSFFCLSNKELINNKEQGGVLWIYIQRSHMCDRIYIMSLKDICIAS